MQPLQEASHISSEELVGGGHTTIVTIAPTTEVHTREPVGLSSRVETPTVVIDGVSSSGSTDALGVMATTVGGPSSSSAPSNDSGQMVVYPRKRGRKRKSDLGGHSSTPIHVPRQRGSAPLVLESQEQSTPKRRGRPPKALSQSMQAMTSQFEAHSMQQVGGATGGWGNRWVGQQVGGANNMDWVNFLGLVDIYSFCHVACRCRMWVWQLLVLGQMWGTLCQWPRKPWPRKA